MAAACWKAFNNAKDLEFYDKTTGVLTELGIGTWRDLLAKANHNDGTYRSPAATAQNKRKVEGESKLDQDGHLSKRKKKMQYATSTNKRGYEVNNGDYNHGRLNAKRIKTAYATDLNNKRPYDEHSLVEERPAKRQAFSR
jgi:hypothetical protein